MVIDYAHAIHAQRLLAALGVAVVYTPYLLIAPEDDDVAATHAIVHRIEVEERYGTWARAFLADNGLIHPAIESSF